MNSTDWRKVFPGNIIPNGRHWTYLVNLLPQEGGKQGHQLTHLNFHFKSESVLIVLKKTTPQGPKVAFLEGIDLPSALYVAAAALSHRTIRWRDDKWRTTRNDKK